MRANDNIRERIRKQASLVIQMKDDNETFTRKDLEQWYINGAMWAYNNLPIDFNAYVQDACEKAVNREKLNRSTRLDFGIT